MSTLKKYISLRYIILFKKKRENRKLIDKNVEIYFTIEIERRRNLQVKREGNKQ